MPSFLRTSILITSVRLRLGSCLISTLIKKIPGDLHCLEDEILPYLKDLDIKKYTGADGTSAVMLKHTAFAIAPSLK